MRRRYTVTPRGTVQVVRKDGSVRVRRANDNEMLTAVMLIQGLWRAHKITVGWAQRHRAARAPT